MDCLFICLCCVLFVSHEAKLTTVVQRFYAHSHKMGCDTAQIKFKKLKIY